MTANVRISRGMRILGFAMLLMYALPASALSNKWRVEFDGAAKVDGEVELAFQPKDMPATHVVVAIPAHTHENHAAHLVRDAIRKQFGRKTFHAEIDDGEDVLVKRRGSTPRFDIRVIRNTAKGLHIDLDWE